MSDENTKFINSLFLKNFIESPQFGEKDVKIKAYTIEPLSEYGSAFTRASIKRVLVKYSSQSKSDIISFVAKIKPSKGDLSEQFKLSGDFTKEVVIYKSILPSLSKVLEKVSENVQFTPK